MTKKTTAAISICLAALVLLAVALSYSKFASPIWERAAYFGLVDKKLPVEGGYLLKAGGRAGFLLPSRAPAPGRPWVWYAPSLRGLPEKHEAWLFRRLGAAGIAIAGIDVGESNGSPEGVKAFDALYAEMVRRGYSPTPVLLARSRGGLMHLAWASRHPDRIRAVAGIYPAFNVASYPGLDKAAAAYRVSPDAVRNQNPLNGADVLARARVPMFILHGDRDEVVPAAENVALLERRYGPAKSLVSVQMVPGEGHSFANAFFQSDALAQFIIGHSLGSAASGSKDHAHPVAVRRSEATGPA